MAFTPLTRRLTLLGGLAAVAAAPRVIPALIDRIDGGFVFEPLATPQGFRALPRGAVSAAIDPFIGLDRRAAPPPPDDLMPALFFARTDPARIQIASFSDFYCPYCRVLTAQLLDIAAELPVEVSWHEWPIFGPPSVMAAKGAIAAGNQGAFAAYARRLLRTPVQASAPYLETLATGLGLDVPRFRADLNSDATQSALIRSAGLAGLFGFPGTPAMVVGRTVVEGAISPVNLRQLIARERADGHTD